MLGGGHANLLDPKPWTPHLQVQQVQHALAWSGDVLGGGGHANGSLPSWGVEGGIDSSWGAEGAPDNSVLRAAVTDFVKEVRQGGGEGGQWWVGWV